LGIGAAFMCLCMYVYNLREENQIKAQELMETQEQIKFDAENWTQKEQDLRATRRQTNGLRDTNRLKRAEAKRREELYQEASVRERFLRACIRE